MQITEVGVAFRVCAGAGLLWDGVGKGSSAIVAQVDLCVAAAGEKQQGRTQQEEASHRPIVVDRLAEVTPRPDE